MVLIGSADNYTTQNNTRTTLNLELVYYDCRLRNALRRHGRFGSPTSQEKIKNDAADTGFFFSGGGGAHLAVISRFNRKFNALNFQSFVARTVAAGDLRF